MAASPTALAAMVAPVETAVRQQEAVAPAAPVTAAVPMALPVHQAQWWPLATLCKRVPQAPTAAMAQASTVVMLAWRLRATPAKAAIQGSQATLAALSCSSPWPHPWQTPPPFPPSRPGPCWPSAVAWAGWPCAAAAVRNEGRAAERVPRPCAALPCAGHACCGRASLGPPAPIQAVAWRPGGSLDKNSSQNSHRFLLHKNL